MNHIEFIDKMIVKSSNSNLSSKAVSDAYVSWHGSSSGRNKLHAALKDRFTFENQMYYNISIVPSKPAESNISEYEKQCLIFKQKKLEMQERIAAEKLAVDKEKKASEEKIAAEKKASEEKIAAEKKASEEKIAAEKKASEEKIAAEKKASEEKIAADKLAMKKELKEMDIVEKQKDRDFMREENNKNRTLTLMTSGFNPYLDLEAYGTNSIQYIKSDSLRKVISFGQFNETNEINKKFEKDLESKITKISDSVIIHCGDNASNEQCIEVSKVSDLLEGVHINTVKLVEAQSIEIQEAPKNKISRVKLPELLKLKESQDPSLFKDKEKSHYVKAANKIRTEGDVVLIDCYCCGKHMRLNSSEVHRCHNIPKSKGGDWSKNNVYLCCAGCNQDMGNEKSVLEYKIDLYVK